MSEILSSDVISEMAGGLVQNAVLLGFRDDESDFEEVRNRLFGLGGSFRPSVPLLDKYINFTASSENIRELGKNVTEEKGKKWSIDLDAGCYVMSAGIEAGYEDNYQNNNKNKSIISIEHKMRGTAVVLGSFDIPPSQRQLSLEARLSTTFKDTRRRQRIS
jgi:hypothetical protein